MAGKNAPQLPYQAPTPHPDVLLLSSVAETEALGGYFASKALKGDVIFLHGNLGAGKTSFSRGYLRYFFQNSALDVPSPSYLLHFVYQQETTTESDAQQAEDAEPKEAAGSPSVEEKQIVHFKASRFGQVPNARVHHLDPYRLPDGKIAALIDLEKMFCEDICLVEWPERLGKEIEIPENRVLHIFLDGVGQQAGARHCRLGGFWTNNETSRWHQVVQELKTPSFAEGPLLKEQSSERGIYPAFVEVYTQMKTADDASETTQNPLNTQRKGRAELTERYTKGERFTVLGIESSCDDTGCAVVSSTGEILGECVASQAKIHEEWGGVRWERGKKLDGDFWFPVNHVRCLRSRGNCGRLGVRRSRSEKKRSHDSF